MSVEEYGRHFSGYREPERRTVAWFHTSPHILGPRVRGVRRLGDDAHGLRASHRQRFGRAHGLRARSLAAPVPRFERGGRRITVLPDGVENRPAKRKENR